MTPSTRAPRPRSEILADRLRPAQRRLLEDVGRCAAQLGARAYAVGGCVRDWLLKRSVDELDVTVEGDSIAVAKAFAAAHRGALTAHPQFRTATVAYRQGRHLRRMDFAACRKEIYSVPAAYPKVSPGSLEEDLVRRDFTINAMAMQIAPEAFGRMIDPHGGARDAQARLIRVLHAHSFQDDPSRILRAIRFATRLQCTIEPQTAAWMRAAIRAQGLSRLNRGRLRKELSAMAQEPAPLECLGELAQWLLDAQEPK